MMNIYKALSFCEEVPIEILNAFEIEVVKLRKISNDAGVGSKYLSNNVCSYSQNAMDYIIENSSEYDAFIFTNSCHAMETLYDICKVVFKDKFVYIIDVPRVDSEKALDYYANVLKMFVEALVSYTGKQVSIAELVKQHSLIFEKNTQKTAFMKEVINNNIFLGDNYKIEEAYEKMNNIDFSNMLKEIKEKQKEVKKPLKTLIYSSNYAPLNLQEAIGEFGNVVVSKPFCEISYEEINVDIYYRIAKFYMDKDLSVVRPDVTYIVDYIIDFVVKYDFKLVILPVIKFCSDMVFISTAVYNALQKKNIYCLIINTEYCECVNGQLITRLEAVLENLI